MPAKSIPLIGEALGRLFAAKGVAAETEAEHKLAKKSAVEAFQEAGQKNYEVIVDDRLVTGTLVEGEGVVIDAVALLEAIEGEYGEDVLDQVTHRTLDSTKLEAAVKLGVIDEELVTAHSELKARAPYVLVKDKAITPDKENSVPVMSADTRATKKRAASKGAPRRKKAATKK